jgi:hypothetical protein
MAHKKNDLSWDEIRGILSEVAQMQKESQQFQKEVQQMQKEAQERAKIIDKEFEEVARRFQETDKQRKETDRQLKETDRQLKETGKGLKETGKGLRITDEKVRNLNELFSTQWGKLIESIVKPSCFKLFRERNIDIERTYTNVEVFKKKEKIAEFDIVLANGEEVVIVEVKTTMTVEKVNDFLKELKDIHSYFPDYKEKTIYGAVAAIRYNEESDIYAYRKGLFVLVNSGKGMIKIANNLKFRPKKF